MAESMEFAVFQEEMGGLVNIIVIFNTLLFQNDGFLKLSKQNVQFKNKSTGKVMTIHAPDIDQLAWQKLGNKPGLKIITNSGVHYRFGGLKESVSWLLEKKNN